MGRDGQHASATRPSSRATPRPRWRRPTSSSRAATSPTARSGAPIEPRAHRRAVAGRQRDGLDARRRCRSPRAAGVAAHAAAARGARAHHRAAPRRRLRRQVRLPLRGATSPRSRARRAPREARLLAPRGVHRPRPPPRGHGHRDRDRREEATARSSRAAASLVLDNGAYCGEGGFFAADRGHARAAARTGSQNVDVDVAPGLHEQPAVRLGARAHGAAGLLGARAAHGRAGRARSAWIRSSCGAASCIDEGDEGPTRPGLRAASACRRRSSGRRDDRLRAGPARRRGDRRRLRLVAVLRRPLRRLREAQRRRLGHDRHRRAGVRHRRRHGAADAGGRGARACSPRTSRSSTRTPTPARGTWARRGSQTTFNNGRAVVAAAERGARAAARRWPPRSWRPPAATSSSSRAPCASRARPTAGHDRRPRAGSGRRCCSATARATCPPRPRSTRRPASAGSAWSPSWRRS